MIAAKNIILFDDDKWQSLLPLTYTKPMGELRIGMLTIKEKWENYLGGRVSYITQPYLSEKYQLTLNDDNLFICGRLLPNPKLVKLINNLGMNEAILYKDELVAGRIDEKEFIKIIESDSAAHLESTDVSSMDGLVDLLERPFDIFSKNGVELKKDFNLLTQGKKSKDIPDNVIASGNQIFIEEGVVLEHCILNSNEGPIYLDKNSKILDGAIVRGPFYLGQSSLVKCGAKIYGPTTLGPQCKVGGEINNVVMQAYSSKSHDGFLGNAVIGEWCNIGADTNASNLKNNYAEVKVWDYNSNGFKKSGLQFCGLIMGDHSKCGINTMFNTGTVVGVSCNIYGAGFPRNFIPSFSWGGPQGYSTYKTIKAFETAEIVMERRKLVFTEVDQNILLHIFEQSAQYRSWDQ